MACNERRSRDAQLARSEQQLRATTDRAVSSIMNHHAAPDARSTTHCARCDRLGRGVLHARGRLVEASSAYLRQILCGGCCSLHCSAQRTSCEQHRHSLRRASSPRPAPERRLAETRAVATERRRRARSGCVAHPNRRRRAVGATPLPSACEQTIIPGPTCSPTPHRRCPGRAPARRPRWP